MENRRLPSRKRHMKVAGVIQSRSSISSDCSQRGPCKMSYSHGGRLGELMDECEVLQCGIIRGRDAVRIGRMSPGHSRIHSKRGIYRGRSPSPSQKHRTAMPTVMACRRKLPSPHNGMNLLPKRSHFPPSSALATPIPTKSILTRLTSWPDVQRLRFPKAAALNTRSPQGRIPTAPDILYQPASVSWP